MAEREMLWTLWSFGDYNPPMIRRILQQSELGDLLSLASPSLFDVISVPTVLRRGREVMADSRRTWADERPALAERVADLVTVHPQPPDGQQLAALPEDPRASVGERILTLYFRQLFSDAPTAVDLRAPAWRVDDDGLHWAPAAFLVRWDPHFIDALRGIYGGFYEDDDAAFVAHLDRLDLGGAADLFRAHIGSGDPRAHTFGRSTFVSSFGAIFDHCKEAGIRLHPDFVLLGAYLGGLYDSLADLGVPLNVEASFFAGRAAAASAA